VAFVLLDNFGNSRLPPQFLEELVEFFEGPSLVWAVHRQPPIIGHVRWVELGTKRAESLLELVNANIVRLHPSRDLRHLSKESQICH
jgi:hypothetical protein